MDARLGRCRNPRAGSLSNLRFEPSARPNSRRMTVAHRSLTLLLLALLLAGCQEKSLLDQVRESGELVVVTRESPTTYYETDAAGLEYELIKRFADELEVRPRFIVAAKPAYMFTLIKRGRAQVAAGGISVTDSAREHLLFGPPYQEITQQVVYRMGTPAPHSPADLIKGRLEVLEGCVQGEQLMAMRSRLPALNWRETAEYSPEQLLYRVWDGQTDFTVSQSNLVDLYRRYYPELRVASFDIGEPTHLAWAFSRQNDPSLYLAALDFFDQLRRSGELDHILDRYYGHTNEEFDYINTRHFLQAVKERLPNYRHLFKREADKHGLDWRLLAAIGYQESWWKPKATSPTGVRGMMMLTKATARQLGVKNRLDPAQSIDGGARYLVRMKEYIPERIPEPDRTWLALAAYNVGYGHLEDARVLTERAGGDPDKWIDVKRHLPLLNNHRYYKTVKHGRARGGEPVRYVERVRSYYDMLVWLDERGPEAFPTSMS